MVCPMFLIFRHFRSIARTLSFDFHHHLFRSVLLGLVFNNQQRSCLYPSKILSRHFIDVEIWFTCSRLWIVWDRWNSMDTLFACSGRFPTKTHPFLSQLLGQRINKWFWSCEYIHAIHHIFVDSFHKLFRLADDWLSYLTALNFLLVVYQGQTKTCPFQMDVQHKLLRFPALLHHLKNKSSFELSRPAIFDLYNPVNWSKSIWWG